MPATATTFGDGKFGITNAETGILIESISYNFTNDKKEIRDRTGNVAGIAYYNERCEVSLQGKIPTSSAFSGTLAATISLTNTIPNHLNDGVSGGAILVEEVSRELSNEDYESVEIKAVLYPNVTAGA